MEFGLSTSCYGGRPDATSRGTDRRAALLRLQALVRNGGLPWVAKLDIASFFDAIPHGPLLAALRQHVASRRLEREVAGYLAWYWQARWPDWPAATPLPDEPVGVPQGSPISGVLANVFLTAFDRSLERAGIVFLRYLDDVTILAASPEALAAGLGTAMDLLESLGMSLRAEKTQAAWLGGGEPPSSSLDLPGRGHELPEAAAQLGLRGRPFHPSPIGYTPIVSAQLRGHCKFEPIRPTFSYLGRRGAKRARDCLNVP